METKLDTFLSRLEKVREVKPEQYTALCPAHKDRSPSLAISGRTQGAWAFVLYCQAGCEPLAVLQAVGMEWKDIAGEEAPARRRPVSQRSRELTAMACCLRLQNSPNVLTRLRYERGWAKQALEMLEVGFDGSRLTLPVRDKDGRLHDTLRYDPFSKTGRKVLAGKGKSRLPWPAPESIDSHILFLVEGEGTAISMLSVGLRAVALPGSMPLSTNVSRPGSWRGTGWHRTWARRFMRFRHVVCLPDCDGQGRALMGAARYDLEREGVKCSIVDLNRALHDGSDVADILLKGAYDSPSRRIARDILRVTVAEQAEVLVA
jgi:hypothetical protein